MFGHVANSIAILEKVYSEYVDYWKESFFDLMILLKFLPDSLALMNARKSMVSSLHALSFLWRIL
jgi:ribonucleotide reductase alpha subunit